MIRVSPAQALRNALEFADAAALGDKDAVVGLVMEHLDRSGYILRPRAANERPPPDAVDVVLQGTAPADLRQTRRALGLTLKALSTATGLSVATLSAAETGIRAAQQTTFSAIVIALLGSGARLPTVDQDADHSSSG